MEVFHGIPQTYFLDESIFDHKWDCSFEGIVGKKYIKRFFINYLKKLIFKYEKNIQKRGNEWYVRPMGCVRYGVKVKKNSNDRNSTKNDFL
jgi:hypothetical protein